METLLVVDLEERIRQYEEEKKRVEASLDERMMFEMMSGSETKATGEDQSGYVADWYIE